MASEWLIVLILISLTTVETEARFRFNNCFHPQISAVNSGHGVVLAQTVAHINQVYPATQIDARPDSSAPDEMKNEGFATAPPPSSLGEHQSFLKAVIVIVILIVTSGGVIVVVRITCNRHGIVSPESLTRDENESKSFGIGSVDPERRTHEPRPIGGAASNYELTICKCNNTFALCGVSV